MLKKIKSAVSTLLSRGEETAARINRLHTEGPLIYDHRIVVWEEDTVNSLIKKEIEKHWYIQSLTFEFEENNMLYLCLITRFGTVTSMQFKLEDMWSDDYGTALELKLDISSIETDMFVVNTIIHLIGGWLLSFLGTFFNPFRISKSGSTVRFEKKGNLHISLIHGSDLYNYLVLPQRQSDSKGPVFLNNARTEQAVMTADYYAFHDPVERFIEESEGLPQKSAWLHSIDVAAAALLPIGVWISFQILHHYLPPRQFTVSFSTYFLISLLLIGISFIVMNIPRYIYMYMNTRKSWQTYFVHNNIKIQMRKLHRRIYTQQQKIRTEGLHIDKAYQERIKNYLLQIRSKRYLAFQLLELDEDRKRKQKIKFAIAYVVCTFLEWIFVMSMIS